MEILNTDKAIILFDGVCNLCNSSVNFIIDRDSKNRFQFAPLQSEIGEKLLQHFQLGGKQLDGIVFIKNNKAYKKSRAGLEITRYLDGVWFLFYTFIIVPPFLRDLVYDFIAKNRYKWFGKSDSCRMPTPSLNAKFLN